MGSMSAVFPPMGLLAHSSSPAPVNDQLNMDATYQMLRGGFDFMIPASANDSAVVTLGGIGPRRYAGTPGVTVADAILNIGLNSWSLDTWTRFDFLFSPRRVDVWIEGDLVTSRTSFNEALKAFPLSVSTGCQISSLWVLGGDLAR